MPRTGLRLSRSIEANGPTPITGTKELRDIAITKRLGLWEPSGLRLSLSCGEIINRTMRITTWRTSPGRGCAKLHEKISMAGLDKSHRKSLPKSEGRNRRALDPR